MFLKKGYSVYVFHSPHLRVFLLLFKSAESYHGQYKVIIISFFLRDSYSPWTRSFYLLVIAGIIMNP